MNVPTRIGWCGVAALSDMCWGRWVINVSACSTPGTRSKPASSVCLAGSALVIHTEVSHRPYRIMTLHTRAPLNGYLAIGTMVGVNTPRFSTLEVRA
jgi:hypothetical protein